MEKELEKQFYEDLREAVKAENMVAKVLESALCDAGIRVENVAGDKRYWHRGDIRLVLPNGRARYIDVKDDGRWESTGNLMSEDSVSYCGGRRKDGFMRNSSYDYVIIHGRRTQRMLLVDFKAWQGCYKRLGRSVVSRHQNQTTYGYLNKIDALKRHGVILKDISYDYSGTYERPKSAWIVSSRAV